jgi:hypothetical protein
VPGNCDGSALAEEFTGGFAIPGHERILSKLEAFNSSVAVLRINSLKLYPKN